mmetsp:Transcript_15496/g.22767  ORF Transcript_15496/g.22767 Transcript_15496/m.22767 type:complete len:93 (+) Transcript_15496:823-1101(+)
MHLHRWTIHVVEGSWAAQDNKVDASAENEVDQLQKAKITSCQRASEGDPMIVMSFFLASAVVQAICTAGLTRVVLEQSFHTCCNCKALLIEI